MRQLRAEAMIIANYLSSISYSPRGIVHVGAHRGQEADAYFALGPDRVVWVEADPRQASILRNVVARHPEADRQTVLEALVAEQDGIRRQFYCFSNDGESSSIFRATELLPHHWPTVFETGEVKELTSRRLDSLLGEACISPEDIDVLVFDVQGAEVLALRGAGAFLEKARFVEVEVSLQPIYEGAPLYDDVRRVLEAAGFDAVTEVPWHGDVVFARRETTYDGAETVAAAPISEASIQAAFDLFHSAHYLAHNEARLTHLASLALPLENKTVLEPGAGIGDHTLFYLARGCSVTAVEPRHENLVAFRRHLESAAPHGDWCLLEGDAGVAGNLGQFFDIVHCYGLLYHLDEPAAIMEKLAARCTGLMVLETCVSFGADTLLNPTPEPSDNPSQAIRGTGCRPTRSWVFTQLQNAFEYVYLTRTQPAHPEFPIDWLSEQSHDAPLARAVFVASRHPLACPDLSPELIDRQVRICR